MVGLNRIGLSDSVWNRRELLRIGGLTLGGVGLQDLLHWRELQSSLLQARESRAKACIFVYLFGGPSQLETFDLKPLAPEDFRGEFRPIDTNVSGISIGEHLPLLAAQADKYTLIRSMTHEHPRHGWGLHHTFTGKRHPRPDLDAPPTPDDDPGLGALVNYSVSSHNGLPPAITLPRWNKFNDLPDEYAGEKAGYLGKTFDPWLINADPNSADFGISGIDLPAGLSVGRFGERLALRHELDAHVNKAELSQLAQRQDSLYQQAVALITSPAARRAFDLSREPESLRNLYGRHPFGQGLLLSRRLVEAGATLITMNWHNDGSDVKSPFWDTHRDNFKTLKERLLPPTDRGLAALFQDLDQRGLLDSTLVVVCGEFGRTPRIGRVVMNAATDATGRDHWPHVYSTLIAGGGVRGGRIYGASDDRGAYVARDPVSPPDLIATILWTLGIQRETILLDRLRRPHVLCEGEPVTELF